MERSAESTDLINQQIKHRVTTCYNMLPKKNACSGSQPGHAWSSTFELFQAGPPLNSKFQSATSFGIYHI